ncbi:hypothetical protein TW95_gp0193 [Pandoravirus inopinatum]|uniref:Uncharacterized protein n=1 Tax=Pandoravirus inopinatum TaxID=1605721 RepID=A0A0B5JBI7_9VIRU|nr:hypothetical protein TW95_gp0193 [Pandoravirus inopinatum]AJF96927.1 hypothetical protein [Pandoravirus inopinatum]
MRHIFFLLHLFSLCTLVLFFAMLRVGASVRPLFFWAAPTDRRCDGRVLAKKKKGTRKKPVIVVCPTRPSRPRLPSSCLVFFFWKKTTLPIGCVSRCLCGCFAQMPPTEKK